MILRLERHLGKELAHDLLDGIERGLLGIDGGEDDRVLAIAERHGFVEGRRQQTADRGGRDEIAGRMADDLLVGRAAGLEIGLGRGERRQRLSAPRFGLRHVGARHLADIKAVLGRLELLGQHGDVVLAQANDGRVAHDIDVSGRGIEQDRLLDGAKASRAACTVDFACRMALRFWKPSNSGWVSCTDQPRGWLVPFGNPPELMELASTAQCPRQGSRPLVGCQW